MRKLIILIALLLTLIGTEDVTLASHQKVITNEDVNEVAKELHPPGCTNSMTADYCPIPTAYPLKNEIYKMLKSGMHKKEIMSKLVDKYGPQILASPEREGITWVAWILPFVALVLGAGFLLLLIKRIKRKNEDSEHLTHSDREPSQIDNEKREQIEREMKNFL